MDRGRAIERRAKRRAAGRLLPAQLGPFELFDHIGRGGMADIYRARKKGGLGLERHVVIKEVLPEYANEERMANLLAEEARIASPLEHPNIVRIEDLQREGDTLYIAMEYVEGLDLREALRASSRSQKRIPIEISIFLVEEVLKALDYAHGCTFTNPDGLLRHGIVHRDVSPSNVLLSLDGEVKLCDFGIARSFDGVDLDALPMDLEGMVEGKAGYMSPEQARGEMLDGRADIFAAGILLWELVSGRKLYKATSAESLFEVARRGQVPALKPRGLPHEDELFALVARATAFDRQERFASAGEMGEALAGYANKAGYARRSFMMQEYLEAEFGDALRGVRRRRELATLALSMGPLASVAVVSVPAPAPITQPEAVNTPEVSAAVEPKKPARAKKARAQASIVQAEPTATRSPYLWLGLVFGMLVIAIVYALAAR